MNTSILETRISTVKKCWHTATQQTTLADVIASIKSETHANDIKKIRQLKAEGKHEQAKALKKSKLPAVMFSGTFDKRYNEYIKDHSGLMVLDFDDCGIEIKTILAQDPHALLCFVSPSGVGLKLVVRIEADGSTHEESFNHAKAYFFDRYQIDADPSGKDLARLCFFSHDPDLIFREDAEVLHRQHRPHMTIHDHTDHT